MMGRQDEYKFTNRRTTNELEHDDSATPETKKVSVYGWYTASAAKTKVVTDSDGHLQIDVLSGGGGGTLVADGAGVSAGTTGQLVLGSDGSNYKIVTTDAAGNLQVDVLSGGGGGTLVTDGEAISSANTGQMILGGDGSNYQLLAVDASGQAQVDVLTLPAITATDLDIRNLDSSADSISVVNVSPSTYFNALINGTLSATATTLQAVVNSAQSLYLTDLVISVSGANNITIVESVSASAAKGGKYFFAANGGGVMNFKTPIKYGANLPIGYLASTDGNFTIVANGYTAA